MSYDLEIYVRHPLGNDEMTAVLRTVGLAGESGGGVDYLMVNDRAGEYAFTLGCNEIEPEDVPAELADAASDARFLYSVLVEGSSVQQIPNAVAFARHLAAAVGGVAIDHQTGDFYGPAGTAPSPPSVSALVEVLDLRWYVRMPDDAGPTARAWVEAAARELPEVFPRRYNVYEPLGRKRSGGDAGVEEFVSFVRAAGDTVLLTGDSPAMSASIAQPATGVPAQYRSGPFGVHSLTLLADPFRGVVARSALKRFFTDFARAIDAVVATAEVVRGVTLDGRKLWYGAESDDSTFLAPLGRWHGLSPYPMWWTWFGPDYAPLVTGELPADQLESYGAALFHARADAPADRDRLVAQLPTVPGVRRWLRRQRVSVPWLPDDLLLTEDRSDPDVRNPPKTAARVIPEALT